MVERHHLLDGLRGIAALAVVIYHIGNIAGCKLVPGGYLAVDFFFILSGFVIARSYGPQLLGGLGVGGFVRLRIARLYPAYLPGFLLGALMLLVQKASHPLPQSWSAVASAVALNAMILPAPPNFVDLFPTDGPAWSLSVEILVNIVYAAGLFRLSPVQLRGLVIAAMVVLIGVTIDTGSLGVEMNWHTADVGAARALFGFSAGVALVYAGGPRRPRVSWLAWTVGPSLALALVVPVAPSWRLGVDLALVSVGFPILLALAARVELPVYGRRCFAFLGRISYPLYAVHFPLIVVIHLAPQWHIPPPVVGAGVLAVAIALAKLVADDIEAPGRRWLGRRLGVRG